MMRVDFGRVVLSAAAGAAAVVLACGAALSGPLKGDLSGANPPPAPISIDYPLNGSIFPPEITPPTFLWHDPNATATRWQIEVAFAKPAERLSIAVSGDLMQKGVIDPAAGADVELTPEEATTHTWRPDAETWAKIKRLSVNQPATIVLRGIAGAGAGQVVSVGRVTISTSSDPVAAPIFYRDVPLQTQPTGEKGSIAPLPPSAIPLIKWQVRNLAEDHSHVVMGNMPTCANCHSFSADGKTLGLDLDGPRNDKGLYALANVAKNMVISNQNVVRWSSFQVDAEARTNAPAVKRFGFMSQVSPDGRYVVTSMSPPNVQHTTQGAVPGFAAGLSDRLYTTNYSDYRFLQVFFPTRGILAWYDRKEQKLRPLPGADDPAFVQTSAFWSPDGKWLIFSRAAARDPNPPGAVKPLRANDPNETQIQYDLYKIPFNEGRGGKAVPIAGASNNGMSNNFPKVSPDGKWIVFVQNKNGLLMRPDSRLFMVPFNGGKARLMNCNTALMNSWHTFSPNGRWLAFSSKARSPYTRLMLTHIDANGNDSPAIIIDNTTAANRAVNIPEFVNIAPDGLASIDPQAVQFYQLVDKAFKQANNNQIPEAIATLRGALERDGDDAMAHYNLAVLLSGSDQEREALAEYRRASELSPEDTLFLERLAVSLVLNGDAVAGVEKLRRAVELQPSSAEFRFNLGYVLESRGDFAAAVEPLEKAVALSGGKNGRFLAELANSYDKTGRPAAAIEAARKALDLAAQAHDQKTVDGLQHALDQYERDGAMLKAPGR